MAMTTRQILEADPHMAYIIDEIPDVKWGPGFGSTEEKPMVQLTIVTYPDSKSGGADSGE